MFISQKANVRAIELLFLLDKMAVYCLNYNLPSKNTETIILSYKLTYGLKKFVLAEKMTEEYNYGQKDNIFGPLLLIL